MDKKSLFKKAGTIIYGTNAQGKRALVMPWTEGRFGYKHKYYGLPKGSIDEGENERIAAVRETFEETGIDIRLLIGEVNYDKFLRGIPIDDVPFESTGYSGVRVLRVGNTPVDYSYTARSGGERRAALFGIEVDGIENLASGLKNAQNANTDDFCVRTSTKVRFADKDSYPQLNDFMEWLRTGDMPQRSWNRGWEAVPNLYGETHHNGTQKTFFCELEQQQMGEGEHITTLKQWKTFMDKIPSKDYKQLTHCFSKIKNTLKHAGMMGGDESIYKLDDKDTPLQFFQEGADIITAENFIERCYHMMVRNPDYALAFGGAAFNPKESERSLSKQALANAKVGHSQLVGIAHFVPPHEMLNAILLKNNNSARRAAVRGKFRKGLESLFSAHPAFAGAEMSGDNYWQTVAASPSQVNMNMRG